MTDNYDDESRLSLFATKGYFIFIEKFRTFIGVSKTSLNWCRSCLSDRTQPVYPDDPHSDPATSIRHEVPQGLVSTWYF